MHLRHLDPTPSTPCKSKSCLLTSVCIREYQDLNWLSVGLFSVAQGKEPVETNLTNFLQSTVVEIAAVDLLCQSLNFLLGIDTWVLTEVQVVRVQP